MPGPHEDIFFQKSRLRTSLTFVQVRIQADLTSFVRKLTKQTSKEKEASEDDWMADGSNSESQEPDESQSDIDQSGEDSCASGSEELSQSGSEAS